MHLQKTTCLSRKATPCRPKEGVLSCSHFESSGNSKTFSFPPSPSFTSTVISHYIKYIKIISFVCPGVFRKKKKTFATCPPFAGLPILCWKKVVAIFLRPPGKDAHEETNFTGARNLFLFAIASLSPAGAGSNCV